MLSDRFPTPLPAARLPCGLAAIAVLALALPGGPAAAAEPLRVCASEQDAPYSLRDGSGLENQVARVVAEAMGRDAEFVWSERPAIYAVRDQLDQELCDVVMGVDADDERVLTTRPYYRSGYVFVTRADRGLTFSTWDDPQVAQLSTWAVGMASPAEAMLRRIGKFENNMAYQYSLVDFQSPRNQYTRVEPSRMINDVVQGEADVAVAFAPEVARYVGNAARPLTMTLIEPSEADRHEPAIELRFDQAMGVRRDDAALRDALDAALVQAAPAIRSVLEAEGVPLLPPGR